MKARAFTLIELLIVVAIIAILAAIAVPNFLEAQVRSKVSRSWADMRSMATAIEAYRVDNNQYPGDGQKGTDGQAFWYLVSGPVPETRAGGITSPVAYMTSGKLFDPFRTAAAAEASRQADAAGDPAVLNNFTEEDYRRFRYRNTRYSYNTNIGVNSTPTTNSGKSCLELYGEWQLMGAGPNRTLDLAAGAGTPVNPTCIAAAGLTNWTDANMIYDPTNGTVSRGDLIRSQKNAQQSGGNYGPGI